MCNFHNTRLQARPCPVLYWTVLGEPVPESPSADFSDVMSLERSALLGGHGNASLIPNLSQFCGALVCRSKDLQAKSFPGGGSGCDFLATIRKLICQPVQLRSYPLAAISKSKPKKVAQEVEVVPNNLLGSICHTSRPNKCGKLGAGVGAQASSSL